VNGHQSKKLRKLVYGDYSLKLREYQKRPDGSVVSDQRRLIYQAAKKGLLER
jgi:hypothetical protein